jgi:trimeric autotransporter adhesin
MKNFKSASLAVLAGAAFLAGSSADAATVNVTAAGIAGTAVANEIHWSSTNTYILQDLVAIQPGFTLRIDAGTVIKGKTLVGSETKLQIPGLVIAQGAKIYAEGTPNRPIIFTAQADDVTNPNDLSADDRALWGGVIVMGRATINYSVDAGGFAANPKYDYLEGFQASDLSGAMKFGGNDDNDNSGVIRYVSIRHGGTVLAANKEINGLTMGAVGRGTTIEYVEVFANEDDGFEWFGGTVNTKYLVSAFCNDDAFDTDYGYSGQNQFWFALQRGSGTQNYGGEYAGNPGAPGSPLSKFSVWNATYIGAGVNATGNINDGFDLKENTAARHYNSVFTDFEGKAYRVKDSDTLARITAGDVDFRNNIWGTFFNNTTVATTALSDIVTGVAGGDVLFTDSTRTNLLVNPQLKGISRSPNHNLDPRPDVGSPALTASNVRSIGKTTGLVQTDYLGAFGPNELWIAKWTALSQLGFLPSIGGNTVNVTAANVTASAVANVIHWTANNTYILKDLVAIPTGYTLMIDPGTVIKGNTMLGTETKLQIPGLVIAQGAKIYAQGTPNQPIIFTAQVDDVNNPNDLGPDDRALWGGVIVMGKATINYSVDAGGFAANPKYDYLEGFQASDLSGAMKFGGNDDNDNSGVIRYVSIRHGGTVLAANKEINGLTMGAVGRGTTIEYVEVFANEDDGYEWFGGTVNTKHLVSVFCNDDTFDTDYGYSGKNQFWFGIQRGSGTQNYGGEYAGNPGAPGSPLSTFTVYNATLIGAGVNAVGAINDGFDLKENTAARHYNSIFTDFEGKAYRVKDNDTLARITAGDLDFRNNIWGTFFNNTTVATTVLSDIVTGVAGGNVLFTDSTRTNLLVDPMLMGISRTNGFGLDPRPQAGSPALTVSNIKALPSGQGYSSAPYIGAFGTVNWASDWTALSEYGILSAAGGGNPLDVEEIPTTGPSTAQVPYVEAMTDGVQFTAVLNSGDNIGGYLMGGIPDGMGAFDNNNGTYTLVMNHELGSTVGINRAHGAKGAYVSKWVIDKSTQQVMSGADLIQQVYLWNNGTLSFDLTAAVAFQRFCSADLPEVSAFYNSGSGLGTQERIFMNGEEGGTGRAMAHVITGADAGKSYDLAYLGRAAWENSLANPYAQDKTIVAVNDDDGTTDSQVYIYVGTKQSTGNEVQKAGLVGGKLYGVSVAGLAQEVAGTSEGVRNFTLAELGTAGNVVGLDANALEADGNGKGVTAFMRVEDGAWNPTNPNEYYFLTTASSSLPSRMWRLTFSDITNPLAGGVIEMVLNGTEGQLMMDNMCFDKQGNIITQEDPGGNNRLARLWKYYPATDGFIPLAQSKPTYFTTGQPNFITIDEEHSAVIDMSDILGEGVYMFVTQVHSSTPVAGPNQTELQEGGQLTLMYLGGAEPSIAIQPTPVNVGGGTGATFTVAASTGATIQWYRNGTPIVGATGTSYNIPSPTTGDAGEYVAIVTTASGSTSSTAVALTVTDLAMYAGVAVAGPIGSQYDVQFTTDLSGTPVWTTLERITISSSPTLYIDQSSPGQAKRFYRALEVAP